MATRVIKLREAEQPAPEMGQEVLSQSKRPEVGPLPPQRIEPERTNTIDLGRDRSRLSPAPHDQALGWAAVVSESMDPAPVIR